MTRQRLASVLVLAASVTAGTHAVVLRHDWPDAETLRLGERFAAVGRVEPDGACTLIRPTWALTAAHVAAPLRPGSRVHFDAGVALVRRTVIHPEGVGRAGVPPEVDLALIELEAALSGITPAALQTETNELGKTLIIVGYGDFGAPGAIVRTDRRRRAVMNVVHDAGPRRVFMRFDRPPAGVELEGVGGPGDSGGPALVERGGQVLVVGVSSASMDGKPGQYGVTDVYTRVSSYVGWIERAIAGQD